MRRSRKKKTAVGLFAGIGGLELGLESAGKEVSLLCEIDPFAQAVLKHRFPDVELVQDIKKLTADSLPKSADTLVGGFPCQDLSQVGRTAGIKGKKSSLIQHMFKLSKSQQIRNLILENVPFLLHLNKGEAIRSLTRSLNKLGFSWAYRTIDSRAFGLPHRRRRLFIVASRDFDPGLRLFSQDYGVPKRLNKPGSYTGFYWTEGNTGIGWTENGIPPLKVGSTHSIPSPPAIWRSHEGDIIIPGISDAESLQGFRRGWTKAAKKTSSDRYRWRLVGNAVSVPAAKWISSILNLRDTKIIQETSAFQPNRSWPTAAYGGPGQLAVQVNVSEFPYFRRVSLERVIKHPQLLSEGAASGFQKRYLKSRLEKRPDFIRALSRHVKYMSKQ